MATRRHLRLGQTVWSSANADRPVIRSGHVSYTDVVGSSLFLFVDAAAAATRGFSNATLRRSIGSSGDRISWDIRASRVQSRPPENRTASFAS